MRPKPAYQKDPLTSEHVRRYRGYVLRSYKGRNGRWCQRVTGPHIIGTAEFERGVMWVMSMIDILEMDAPRRRAVERMVDEQ
jgi:hypothetical protein